MVDRYRGRRITDLVAAVVADKTGDVESMARIQADHHNGLAKRWLPYLFDALKRGRALSEQNELTGNEQRIKGIYEANAARL